MSFDWKVAIGAVAPTLATVLGGPLAGGAVSILADKILGKSSGDPVADEAKLAGLFAGGLTPELRVKVLDAEQQVKLAVIAADLRKAELAADFDKASLMDIADARAHNAQTVGILRLGYGINAASYLCIAGVLYGAFTVLTAANGLKVDPGTAAMIGGVIGGVVQWLMTNAAQANGFFYGSSPSSRQVATDLSKSVGKAAEQGVVK